MFDLWMLRIRYRLLWAEVWLKTAYDKDEYGVRLFGIRFTPMQKVYDMGGFTKKMVADCHIISIPYINIFIIYSK
jgi:hypothetical protein